MRRRRQLSLAAGWLIVLHLVALLAGFFAPYDPTAQHPLLSIRAAHVIHLVDETGNWRRPFVYGGTPQVGTFGQYREDRTLKFPVRLAPAGKPDQFDANASRHLFGVDEPGRIFLMGTDEYGRDLFSRLVHGVRISLAAGLLATLFALGLGVLVGSAAGWLGGWTDGVIMRASELFVSLPWLYLLFGVRAFLPLNVPPEQAFLLFVGIAGIIGWAKPARLVRGMVMTAREREYVSAARGFGASQVYLLKRAHRASGLAADSDSSLPHDSQVHPRRIDALVSRTGHRRAGSQLGRTLGQAAAIPRAGFLLVGVLARSGDDDSICRVLHCVRRTQGTWVQ